MTTYHDNSLSPDAQRLVDLAYLPDPKHDTDADLVRLLDKLQYRAAHRADRIRDRLARGNFAVEHLARSVALLAAAASHVEKRLDARQHGEVEPDAPTEVVR